MMVPIQVPNEIEEPDLCKGWPQLWRQAVERIAEVLLDGIARVRSVCTAMGRAWMASDLEACSAALPTAFYTSLCAAAIRGLPTADFALP